MTLYSSEDFYTEFTKSYEAYASNRRAFIDAVDNFVKSESALYRSIIDVGSGNGKRARRIADSIKARSLTLVDNSSIMIDLSRQINNANVLFANIASPDFTSAKKYEIVLCLWNVLGHILSAKERNMALNNLKNLIATGGVLFLDINNRYNVSQYGIDAVLRNILKDALASKDSNGDFELTLDAGINEIRTKVHIFSPYEIERLIKSAGLKILKKQVINYSTGEKRKSIFGGQLIYKLSR